MQIVRMHCRFTCVDHSPHACIPVVQVGGFLQRIDYVRKYAFGVMCILKNSEGQFPIRGFWIFRGQDIPQMMKDECYDLELYEWQKLDSKNLDPVSLLLLLLCCPSDCLSGVLSSSHLSNTPEST